MVAALVALGGVGAGIVAIRTGKAETMAQVVLSGLFINAVMATILLGFGMNAVFSEAELLPLSAAPAGAVCGAPLSWASWTRSGCWC